MSFITSQQANIQGCKIETPHSQDIRDICGTAMCAGQDPDLLAGGTWLMAAGWADLGGGRFERANTSAVNEDVYQEINSKLTASDDYVLYYTIETLTAGAHAGRCAGNSASSSTAVGQTLRTPFNNLTIGSDITGVRAFTGAQGLIVSNIRLYALADDPGS